MAFSWNFKPKTLNGFNPQPVESLAPQAPQPLDLQMKGMENTPANQPIENPLYQRAAYMDEYEADEARKAQAMQAQQAGQEKRIADIQNEIATLEKRIAENTAKLQNWAGNADQIAAIEARKINVQDPTYIWRWKEDRDNSLRLAEQKAGNDTGVSNAQYEITNTLAAIRPNAGMDSATQQRYFQQLADLRTLAQKNGLSTDAIDAKIREVEGDKGQGEEQTSREKAKTEWKGLKGDPNLTSTKVSDLLNNPDVNWDPDERKEAENMLISLKKKEADVLDVKNMKNWVKTTYGTDWSTLSPRLQQTYQRLWKNRKGKK